jgi:transient receptor potential cation channel subfamily A member 1
MSNICVVKLKLYYCFRAEEIMTLKSDRHPCVTLALIASMPRVFEAVQDKCITKANCKKDSKQFYVGNIK